MYRMHGKPKVLVTTLEMLYPLFNEPEREATFRGGLGRKEWDDFSSFIEVENFFEPYTFMVLYAKSWKDPEGNMLQYDQYGPVVHQTTIILDGMEHNIRVRWLSGMPRLYGLECPTIFDVLYTDNRRARWKQLVAYSRTVTDALPSSNINFTPDVVWINDAHPALTAPLVHQRVNSRAKVLFTTHTQQESAMECFEGGEWRWEETTLPDSYIPLFVERYGKCNLFLGVANVANAINAVSRKHGDITRQRILPQHAHKTTSVTNGVGRHWQLPEFRRVEISAPESKQNILDIHEKAKDQALAVFEKYKFRPLDRSIPWAMMVRRPQAYKNMYVPVKAILPAICGERSKIFQTECGELEGLGMGMAIAFIASPTDSVCADWMRGYSALTSYFRDRFVYIPDYSYELFKAGISGADVWLEIPIVGHEGCGTSGRTCALNAIPTISTMDGGNIEWIEQFDPTTGSGNGFYMDPDYDPCALHRQLKIFSDTFYAYYEGGDKRYPDLLYNVLQSSEELTAEKSLSKGYAPIFDYLTQFPLIA